MLSRSCSGLDDPIFDDFVTCIDGLTDKPQLPLMQDADIQPIPTREVPLVEDTVVTPAERLNPRGVAMRRTLGRMPRFPIEHFAGRCTVERRTTIDPTRGPQHRMHVARTAEVLAFAPPCKTLAPGA
ncbi:hypothetical protein [Burkholderia lata]|uniref:hypothetical protein n=1 Tax=Burkholderia lata (strain ATCC 17760 / DSM 23089 / LMG 22485 / NCIMB 9086 / R18194 / 383) TaxID=482957 RepID=UPI00242D884C|nr:hypothetical protein [Burkholderia lata]